MYEIKQLLKDKAFVKEIEYLEEEKRKSIFLRKCKIVLNNFSILRVKEIWKSGQLLKYSYYWFNANNKLIIGWDNAQHHSEVASFPHHRHKEDGVEASAEKDLRDVCNYIEDILQS